MHWSFFLGGGGGLILSTENLILPTEANVKMFQIDMQKKKFSVNTWNFYTEDRVH